jgi:sulfur carrier protein ThiS
MADHRDTHPAFTNSEEVVLTYRRQSFTVAPGMTVRDAISRCGLDPEATLAVMDGELITDEVVLKAGDRVKLLATISGG